MNAQSTSRVFQCLGSDSSIHRRFKKPGRVDHVRLHGDIALVSRDREEPFLNFLRVDEDLPVFSPGSVASRVSSRWDWRFTEQDLPQLRTLRPALSMFDGQWQVARKRTGPPQT